MAEPIKTVEWAGDKVRLIDQTRLPVDEYYIECARWEEVADAIKTMRVRGAPAIGVAAALGTALAGVCSKAETPEALASEVEEALDGLAATRPTAVNLFWAVKRMRSKLHALVKRGATVDALRQGLVDEAVKIAEEDVQTCLDMGAHGSELIADGDRILTHCNAGGLATCTYGTALGVIRSAHEQGKKIRVYVDETRPLLQGARLTAWELTREGIPATLITDSMAGFAMARGMIDKAIVGADRITANGDVANKIGTYTVAAMCARHGLPVYVAAPMSTIDFDLEHGDDIPIEERGSEEVTEVAGTRLAPAGMAVWNPAFDVTPAELVTAIITERGIARPPYAESLAALRGKG